MKRILLLLLILALCLSAGACGKKNQDVVQPGPDATPVPEIPVASTPDNRRYERVDINMDNWSIYFELREVPLYSVTSTEVIAQVYENYCVVLKEAYQPYIKPEGSYRVDFEVEFDLYVDTLKVDTKAGVYEHTDDMLYAAHAVKPATYDCHALTAADYGADHSRYKDYSNAFFSGWATIHPDSKVWSGFYMDLSAVTVNSASGYIELAQ